MADYSSYSPCATPTCNEDVNYFASSGFCLNCQRKKEREAKLNELRPIVKEILKEEGLID